MWSFGLSGTLQDSELKDHIRNFTVLIESIGGRGVNNLSISLNIQATKSTCLIFFLFSVNFYLVLQKKA